MTDLLEQLGAKVTLLLGHEPPHGEARKWVRFGKNSRLWLTHATIETSRGAYLVYACGNFAEGVSYKGRIPDAPISIAELKRFKAEQSRIERERGDYERKHQEEVAAECQQKWALLRQEFQHPYLACKEIDQSFGARCNEADDPFYLTLYIPARDTSGKIWSLQSITASGTKSFWPGGRVKGCFHLINGNLAASSTTVICEGFATGASVAMACPELTVLCAFSAGNLKQVACEVRKFKPSSCILILADDDPSGAGERFAREAASAVGGSIYLPKFNKTKRRNFKK